MSKKLLSLVALVAVCLSAGYFAFAGKAKAPAVPKEAVVVNGSVTSDKVPVPMGEAYTASQMIYTSASLDAATGGAENYQITKLMFPISKVNSSGRVDFEIYATATNATNLTGFYPTKLDEMTLVCTETQKTIDASLSADNPLTFTLDTPIELKNGEGLLLCIMASQGGNVEWRGLCQEGSGINYLRYSGTSEPDFSARWSTQDTYKLIPSLKIGYSVAGEGGGDTPDPDDPDVGSVTVVAAGDDSSNRLPVYFTQTFSGSQTIYKADMIEAATEGAECIKITKLYYPMKSVAENGTANFTVYAGPTSLTEFAGGDPIINLPLVGTYNNMEISSEWSETNPMTFELDTPIILQKGENLAVYINMADNNTEIAAEGMICTQGVANQGIRSYNQTTNVANSAASSWSLDDARIAALSIEFEVTDTPEPPEPPTPVEVGEVTKTITGELATPWNTVLGVAMKNGSCGPMCGTVKNFSDQVYYTAEQLGLTPLPGESTVNLVKLTYSYYYEGDDLLNQPLKVYMANSTKGSFSTGRDMMSQGAMTKVFDGNVSITPDVNGNGKLEIILNGGEGFNYDPSKNLAIAFYKDNNVNGNKLIEWPNFRVDGGCQQLVLTSDSKQSTEITGGATINTVPVVAITYMGEKSDEPGPDEPIIEGEVYTKEITGETASPVNPNTGNAMRELGPYTLDAKYSADQLIYTSAELALEPNEGETLVAITQIAFPYTFSGESAQSGCAAKIYMANVDKTSFDGNTDVLSADDMTLVFDGTFAIEPGENKLEFALAKAFNYDPSKNLAIYIQKEGEESSIAGLEFTNFATEGKQQGYWYNGNTSFQDKGQFYSTFDCLPVMVVSYIGKESEQPGPGPDDPNRGVEEITVSEATILTYNVATGELTSSEDMLRVDVYDFAGNHLKCIIPSGRKAIVACGSGAYIFKVKTAKGEVSMKTIVNK